MAYKPGSVRMA